LPDQASTHRKRTSLEYPLPTSNLLVPARLPCADPGSAQISDRDSKDDCFQSAINPCRCSNHRRETRAHAERLFDTWRVLTANSRLIIDRSAPTAPKSHRHSASNDRAQKTP